MITLSASAVVLSRRRRPADTIGATPAHPGARHPALVFGTLVLLGTVLPLLGASMVLVLLLESFVLGRFASVRRFPGLGQLRWRA